MRYSTHTHTHTHTHTQNIVHDINWDVDQIIITKSINYMLISTSPINFSNCNINFVPHYSTANLCSMDKYIMFYYCFCTPLLGSNYIVYFTVRTDSTNKKRYYSPLPHPWTTWHVLTREVFLFQMQFCPFSQENWRCSDYNYRGRIIQSVPISEVLNREFPLYPFTAWVFTIPLLTIRIDLYNCQLGPATGESSWCSV